MAVEDDIARFFQQYGKHATQSADPCLQAAVNLLHEIAQHHTTLPQEITAHKHIINETELVCRGFGHNFNGILANIRGTAEIIQMKVPDLPDNVRKGLNTILSLSDRGAYSTNMIRLYGKAFNDQRQQIELQNVLPGMLNDIKINRPIDFPVRIEAGIAATVNVHTEMLEACFAILIRNALQAIQFSQTNAPEIIIGITQSRLSDNTVCLQIQDNGEGMSEETIKKACEPFFTTRKAADGIGLGLTIVHNFATQHGGYLSFQSAPEKGTTVTLHLQRA
jgi:C4-dicarboxylate-specific signal transduction histidine kinase